MPVGHSSFSALIDSGAEVNALDKNVVDSLKIGINVQQINCP